MIDVQVDPPAVRPCLHLRNSTLSSRSLRLWPLLTVKRRQKRRLREAGPGEGAQSPLGPVDPVQVAGLQEGREAAVLWEDATRASPVGEMFPADVPTENGTAWYFVLLVHAPQKRRLWAGVGEFCTKCKEKCSREKVPMVPQCAARSLYTQPLHFNNLCSFEPWSKRREWPGVSRSRGRRHLCCPGSLEVATPICIYICGVSVTSCWRMRASFIQSSSTVASHGRSYLSAEVHKPVLWERERRVFVGRLQTTPGSCTKKEGGKNIGGGDTEEAMLRLCEEFYISSFMSVALEAHQLWFDLYFPPCLGLTLGVTWLISPTNSTDFQKTAFFFSPLFATSHWLSSSLLKLMLCCPHA